MRARLAAVLLLTIASAAFGLEIPPTPKFFYTDDARLLDSTQAKALNDKLAAFEQRSGVQFIVYVFPSLEGEALEDFTIRCAERWKVGNKKFDNGLILFVFVKERKIRIEVGYGLERTVTDAMASRVIREYIAPHFKQGDYVGGLNAGVDALIALIEKKEAPVPPAQPRQTGPRQGSSAPPCGSIIGLLFFIVAIVIVASLITRSRPGCGGCFWPMFFWPGGSGGSTFGGGGFSGGGGGGFGGFSSGGGSFGGGGASGGW